MLTGQLRNDIDNLWEKFWTGGIANPLTVIEQTSYLMFARMLDAQEELAERKAAHGGKTVTRLFPDTKEGQLLRWKNFKQMSGKEMLKHLKSNVYPHFAQLGNSKAASGDTTLANIAEYMQDADMEIKNESVLVAAVEMIEKLPLNDTDVKGDIYEYLLSKLTTAGINGQFRTPRHIIDMMIALVDPQPEDVICDPACGTAGFLARTMEYLNRQHSSEAGTFTDDDGNQHFTGDQLEPYRKHINSEMFWGFDFDNTMLRVSSMNMLLHGVNGANINYQDSLNKSIKENYPKQEKDFFDVVLANPPFKGAIDENNTNPDVLNIVKTKKTELLFVAHILTMLKLGGRSATVVPDGVLFGSSRAHKQLREELIERNQLEGIISLPSGVFKPYAGVSTAILLFTKGGETDQVWFYDVQADGYSLDDKRTLSEKNDLPDVLDKWQRYCKLRLKNKLTTDFEDKTQACFVVPVEEIRINKYDLSINRYKEMVYEEEQHEHPKAILKQLMRLEEDIQTELKDLERML